MKGRGFSIAAFRLIHSVPTYGYAFVEDDKLRFIKEKCARLGIKGEMFSRLQKSGRITVRGRAIALGSVSRKEKGRRVVYVADTRPSRSAASASKDADILIHEATYADSLRRLARERLHSTALEAARVAAGARAKRLLLFHMSARYKDTSELLREARKAFRNSEVAYDGMSITI